MTTGFRPRNVGYMSSGLGVWDLGVGVFQVSLGMSPLCELTAFECGELADTLSECAAGQRLEIC